MAAKRQTAQNKAATAGQDDISAMADELRETERKAEEIRERAKGMLPGIRQTAEDAVSDYNRLIGLSGSGGPLLDVVEEDGLKTAQEASAEDSPDADKGRRAKAVSGPGRGQNGHDSHDGSDNPMAKTMKGAQAAPPLDPNSVDFADKDGVVVDDYKTTDQSAADDGGADADAESDDQAGPDEDADDTADGNADDTADDDDDDDMDPDDGGGNSFDFLSDDD